MKEVKNPLLKFLNKNMDSLIKGLLDVRATDYRKIREEKAI